MTPTDAGGWLTLIPLDGPTHVIDVAGLRLLVDPTFDAAQEYPLGSRSLVKTTDATWSPAQLGLVDAVLLSHDQHPDNLDHAGREYLSEVPLTITTPVAAGRLGGSVVGLEPWARHQVGSLQVVAVPARHGPDGTEHLTGPVTGFVLATPDDRHVYVSGDNASLEVVRAVAEHFPRIDVAVLFAGAARTPLVDGYLTLTSDEAAEATGLLGRPWVLPVHTDGWAHFTEDGAALRRAFGAAGVDEVLLPVEPGTPVTLR